MMVFDHPNSIPLAWVAFLVLLVSPWLTAVQAVRWILAAQRVAGRWAFAAAAAAAAAVALAFGMAMRARRPLARRLQLAGAVVLLSAVYATPWVWPAACAARFAWRRWQARAAHA